MSKHKLVRLSRPTRICINRATRAQYRFRNNLCLAVRGESRWECRRVDAVREEAGQQGLHQFTISPTISSIVTDVACGLRILARGR